MDWDSARIVLAIHRAGSLTSAGKMLNLDQSTVGRRLAAFEDEMRVRLFERRGLRMVPTNEGEIVVAHAEKMEAEAFALAARIRGRDDSPHGEVVVTAVEALIRRVLLPRVPALTASHPGIRPVFLAGNSNLLLEKGEADIAIRLARPEGSRLVARRIARLGYRVHAHRDLLRNAGTDDPAHLPWVHYGPGGPYFDDHHWLMRHYPAANIVLRVNSAAARATAVRLGIGAGIIPSFYTSGQPDVVALSGAEPVLYREVWMLTLPEYRERARIVPVLAWIAGAFGAMQAVLSGEDGDASQGRG